jgi:hypothetical protein
MAGPAPRPCSGMNRVITSLRRVIVSVRPQRKEVVPDAERTHDRTALRQHRLAPLRQPPGDGPAVIAWRQFPDEQHQ